MTVPAREGVVLMWKKIKSFFSKKKPTLELSEKAKKFYIDNDEELWGDIGYNRDQHKYVYGEEYFDPSEAGTSEEDIKEFWKNAIIVKPKDWGKDED